MHEQYLQVFQNTLRELKELHHKHLAILKQSISHQTLATIAGLSFEVVQQKKQFLTSQKQIRQKEAIITNEYDQLGSLLIRLNTHQGVLKRLFSQIGSILQKQPHIVDFAHQQPQLVQTLLQHHQICVDPSQSPSQLPSRSPLPSPKPQTPRVLQPIIDDFIFIMRLIQRMQIVQEMLRQFLVVCDTVLRRSCPAQQKLTDIHRNIQALLRSDQVDFATIKGKLSEIGNACLKTYANS